MSSTRQSPPITIKSRLKMFVGTVAVGLLPALSLAQPQFQTPIPAPLGLTPAIPFPDPEFADLDGDADFDVYCGTGLGPFTQRRNSGSSTSPSFATLSPSDVNPHGLSSTNGVSSPTFADLDGDGDLDVMHSWAYSIYFQRNTGNSTSPSFGAISVNPFGLTTLPSYPLSPELVDLDGDADFDLFVGDVNGMMHFFRNTAAPGATEPAFATVMTNPFGLTSIPASGSYPYISRATMAFMDVEGDGDLDTFVGSQGGNFYLFTNTGSSSSPAFGSPSVNPFGLSNVGTSAGCDLVDIDGDGDLDFLVGSSNNYTMFFNAPVDTIDPNSSANIVATATASPNVSVNFMALDNATGIREVTLWAKVPGGPGYTQVDSHLTPGNSGGSSGTFNYVAGPTDGLYEFYTLAQDHALNVEDPPAIADDGILVDRAAPTSSAGIIPTIVGDPNIDVDYTASDATTSISQVELWVKVPGSGSFVNTGLVESGSSGDFSYTATAGGGTYEFYTIATDQVGNTETAPASADDSVFLDPNPGPPTANFTLLQPSPTDINVVGFRITMSEPVGTTFTAGDLELTGSLATGSQLHFSSLPGDPVYSAFVVLGNPNANGTIGLRISGVVQDVLGNAMTVPVDSPVCSVTHHPAGDVNKDGVFNIADVALLADANLGLATLP